MISLRYGCIEVFEMILSIVDTRLFRIHVYDSFTLLYEQVYFLFR